MILKSKSIYYDDVNLIAQKSSVSSRSEIYFPNERIVVSPMSSVVGKNFALEAAKLGLSVCIHRFCSIKEQADLYLSLEKQNLLENVYFCIGKSFGDKTRFNNLYNLGCRKFVLDIANGYLKDLGEYIDFICQDRDKKELTFIIGNVHSAEAVDMYKNFGFEQFKKCIIRTGIGNGKACLTKNVTGYNRGQITEIDAVSNSCRLLEFQCMADGGIKSSGEAVKAFGAGADYVMMGHYFSFAEEAQNVIDGDYCFWGGASERQQKINQSGQLKHSEGTTLSVDFHSIKPLSILVNDLVSKIKSGISYSGFSNLNDFVGNGIFEVKV